MIRVQAPSRLHFGLLSFGAEDHWTNRLGEPGLPARRFGSVGLMVQKPGVSLVAQPAPAWSAEGPLADRALTFARKLIQTLPPEAVRPQRLLIEASAPEHSGLGTGTQLGLAVARAVSNVCGLPHLTITELAQRIGRGQRSALGIHGFAQGGFLVDGGKRAPDRLAPLVARAEVPEAWRVVLVLPHWAQGLHGDAEIQAFGRLAQQRNGPDLTARLCHLVLLGMLPALAERDLEAFGEAVFDFNAHVGEAFAAAQGGIYAPHIAEIVTFIRQQGIRGVGQSSWGPSVFAVTEDEERANALVQRLRRRFAFEDRMVLITPACRQGALTVNI